jgi:hypothetical protein
MPKRPVKVQSHLEALAELEELAAKLLKTACELRPGAQRHEILQEIGKFRVRIAMLRKSEDLGQSD